VRFPLEFQCLPAVVLLCGIFFLTESLQRLVEKDRHDEARIVRQELRSYGAPQTHGLLELELQEIRDVVAADRLANQTPWKTLFTKPSWRRRLILGCGVQAFGPVSGIDAINYYEPRIYKILGIQIDTSLMIIGISGALSIVYHTIGLLLVDRVGRVKLLIVSAAGMAGALVMKAAMSQHLNLKNYN